MRSEKRVYKWLALVVALFLVVQMLPISVLAQGEGAETTSGVSAQNTDENEVPQADWEGTGAMNSDGTPVTADQGDTPDAGGAGQATQADEPQQPATYTLTLDLDGGQVNGLQGAGWTQSASQTYQWTSTVTESQAGQGVTITADGTLGGLLPGQPYRAGYEFTGWSIGGTEDVTIKQDTTITAQWEVTTYTVTFRGSGPNSLWTVEVPYGSTLWVEPDTPWTANDVTWSDENTATVDITVGGKKYENITVTRHAVGTGDLQQYYYTFTIDSVPYFTYGGDSPTQSGYHFTTWKMTSGGSGGFTVLQDTTFTAQFQAEKTYVFNIYYYFEDGTKAANTATYTKAEQDIQDGKLVLSFDETEPLIPIISHYSGTFNLVNGVTWGNNQLTVDVNTVFGAGNTSATNFLALTVTYAPTTINYTVEYYQQPVGVTDYTQYRKVGSKQDIAPYGSIVSVKDRPNLGNGVSFDGFQVSADSQTAIHGGVVLEENVANVTFDDKGAATIKIYYDRASYFIYFQTGTPEHRNNADG